MKNYFVETLKQHGQPLEKQAAFSKSNLIWNVCSFSFSSFFFFLLATTVGRPVYTK